MKVHRRTARGDWHSEPDVYRNRQTFELAVLTGAIAVAISTTASSIPAGGLFFAEVGQRATSRSTCA